MVDDSAIQAKLAAIIVEIYDVLSLQDHGCHILDLDGPEDRDDIADRAQHVMTSWHELHEFDAAAHVNPQLLKALLVMYSDTIATYHEIVAQDTDPAAMPGLENVISLARRNC